MKVFTGVLALAFTALPAALGRLIQMIHYHSMSAEERKRPQQVGELPANLREPHLKDDFFDVKGSGSFLGQQYQGMLKEADMISILRWGHRQDTVHVSNDESAWTMKEGEPEEVKYTLSVSLDLQKAEIANMEDVLWAPGALANPRQFLNNGYRAAQYTIYDEESYGYQTFFAVFDPSCISVRAIWRTTITNSALENRRPIAIGCE